MTSGKNDKFTHRVCDICGKDFDIKQNAMSENRIVLQKRTNCVTTFQKSFELCSSCFSYFNRQLRKGIKNDEIDEGYQD